jgi:hypothetical protein
VPISSGVSRLTPTVMRPRVLTARSYHVCNGPISRCKVARMRSAALSSSGRDAKLTGQARGVALSATGGASSGQSTNTAPLGASSNCSAARRTRV